MTDDLFTPTIRTPSVPAVPPWRPESIVYPAFFGGALAATVLGVLNGRRLALARTQLWLIVGAGIAAVAARAVFVASTEGLGRISGVVAGLLVWLVINTLQRRPFRAFLQNNGEPASLVGPGFLAAIGCGLAELILIYGVLT
jgi:hypothetical protein